MTFEEHIPLAPHTTFRIGGEARYFCAVTSREELLEAFAFADSRKVKTLVLGGGSNILIGDSGFPGLVIQMNLRGIREEVAGDLVRLEVGAGESWDGLVSFCVDRGYWGMENLSLIPGTVGAAPVQNIGAYGTEAKDIVESVSVVRPATGESRLLSNAECGFGYRDSVFKRVDGKGLVITGVTFVLSKKPRPNLSYKDLGEYFAAHGIATPALSDVRDVVISIRKSKFPDLSRFGTAGSFWKNPVISLEAFTALRATHPLAPSYPAGFGAVKVPLAWVLDVVCGLKGHVEGPVHLFSNQPLVLTVEKGATAAQVDAFARSIESVVRAKTGIIIEREVNSLLC
ncbi:MAG: UDP-N-acetylmuramate dehydrogenase [Candidatus Paceibacterota bacterium]|jgi:UDP-N-acetylmuramate dehydrogenase